MTKTLFLSNLMLDKHSQKLQTECMQIWRRLLVVAVLVIGFSTVSLVNRIRSASLTSVSVTLSNSRHSFNGRLAAGNTVGASSIIINTTAGAYASTDSAQLVQGDSLGIGGTGNINTYTVTDVVSTGVINITPVLASGDTESGDVVISTQSGTLTARLTTANAVANGRFRVLIPALPSNTNASDGIPDQGFFDFSASTPSVVCPSDISGYDFVAGTATASAVTLATLEYHSFECAYSGAGAIGSPFDGTTNGSIGIGATNPLINPAPKSGHLSGTADTYKVIIQHLDSAFAVKDTTSISIGVIEAVKVTAAVEPQISFKITGVNASVNNRCGTTTTFATTATTVPFGSLSISGFANGTQNLAVSTNAVHGYVVTAIENDQLGLNGATCTGDPWNPTANYSCIRDSVGDASAMTHTVSDEWSATTVKGFAYSMEDVNATNAEPAFEYTNNSTCTDTADGGTCTACDGTGDCFRQFADAENSQAVVRIFGSDGDTVADNDNVFVCYRGIISATQAAGNYENYLTYTATATF